MGLRADAVVTGGRKRFPAVFSANINNPNKVNWVSLIFRFDLTEAGGGSAWISKTFFPLTLETVSLISRPV